MHELGLAQNIVEMVAEHAEGRRISRIILDIGVFAGVSIDAMRFCFDLATEGTALEGARLEINEIEGRARCQDCGRSFVQESVYMPCPCGAHAFLRVSGEEFRVKSYELA